LVSQIQRKHIFVTAFGIMILIFVVSIIILSYKIDAQALHERTLNIIANETKILKGTPQVNVGRSPIDITGMLGRIYVANLDSGSISVIDANNNTKIKDIPVGIGPRYMAVNFHPGTIYVANYGSGTVSVIDGVTDKVVAGITFNVSPANSGRIICDNIDSPINQYLFLFSGTTCIAKPNKGFEFSSWVQNLNHNSTRTITTSTVSDSPLNFLLNTFGVSPVDTGATLNVTQFGSFNANFKALPPPIPPEYWIPLYGIIVSSIVGWSIPNIIGGVKTFNQRRRFRQCPERNRFLKFR
jgi:YVTN family beta-propeller protein